MSKEKKQRLFDILQTKDPSSFKMLIGFDGFIDEIIHVVDKRKDAETFTRIETISALGDRIKRASGLSTNIELYPSQKKIGGNGPIMCNALAMHNPTITYIGALGVPNIDEVFLSMPSNVTLKSFANSGHTDALEFDDGKLMLGKMATLNDVTYENLISHIGEDAFIQYLNESNLTAMVNWSMLPYMTNLWEKLIAHILPKLNKKELHPILFFDLADPEKREDKEILKAISLMKKFNSHFRVVLGLNKKEAYDIANVLHLFDEASLTNMQVSLEDLTIALYDYIDIYSVVIHPVDRSCTVIDNVFYEETGPYVEKPKLTTGAGDNFNAGYCLGLLLNLTPDQALLLGMSTSGYYVRNAKSPNFQELKQFILEWKNDFQ
jgi:hypothetical protein